MKRRPGRYPIIFAAAFLAAGCERLGIEDPTKIAAEHEAEGKAIGGGCRHSGRSLEDCFALNEGALKAAVFSGWKEMNDYMTSNNLQTVPSALPRPPAATAAEGAAAQKAEAAQAGEKRPSAPPSEKH